jgi:hypothetical protein
MTDEPLLDPDPYPYYEQLRTHHPVQRMSGTRLDPDHELERNPGLLFYSFKTLPIRFGPGGPGGPGGPERR